VKPAVPFFALAAVMAGGLAAGAQSYSSTVSLPNVSSITTYNGAPEGFDPVSAADSQLEEAHYRLAQAYRRTGEKRKAEEEIKVYDQISEKTAQRAEEEGREIPQFVYTLRDPKSPAQSQ